MSDASKYLTSKWLIGILTAMVAFFAISWINGVEDLKSQTRAHAERIAVQDEILTTIRDDVAEIKASVQELTERK